MKKLKIIIALLTILVIGLIHPLVGQKAQLTIITKDNQAVYHDKNSQTIDIFLTAEATDKLPFWDFNAENLIISEEFNGQKDTLPIIFQGKVRDAAVLETGEVYQIKTRSKTNYHKEERTYIIKWLSPSGNNIDGDEISQNWLDLEGGFSLVEKYSFLDIFMLGALVLSLLLLILSEMVPIFRKRQFEKEYVSAYSNVQKTDERLRHPITEEYIRPNEELVVMCSREECRVPYEIWKKRNYKCMYFPEKCNGSANIGTKQFFQQAGFFKKMNWFWFGALGGLIAWVFTYSMDETSLGEQAQFAGLPMGIGLGLGLTFMLTLVDELGRDVSVVSLLLKTSLGGIAAGSLFYIATNLGITDSALGTALTWVTFCVILGAILSIKSSIFWLRGVLSGLIAGLASGLIYWLFANLLSEAELVKMVTFLLLGSVLGWGIIQVVRRLDKIELELQAPSERSGLTFPLDKWLNNGEKIIIGKDIKRSNVRVKWDDDYVLPAHAELSMKDNMVYIKPLEEAEIWVNDNLLTNEKSKIIKGGDRIRLSRIGPTVFKYLQKSNA